MQRGQPSRTALAAAYHRAAHQVLEDGRIFADPLAIRILGETPAGIRARAEERPDSHRMRLFIAVRTRFAEDALAAAVERGVTQLVILGAGVDTYAYRGPLRDRLHIFEVDHPATQAWKRQRLAEAAIPEPSQLTFAPIDFEHQTLADGLAAAGFDPARQTFFIWLGVVPYLSEDAVWSTLAFIAGLPAGAQVVFDYSDPPESFAPEGRADHDARAARVAGLGEAWISYFDPPQLRVHLAALGFRDIEDLGPSGIAARYFPRSTRRAADKGGHILRAATL